jgi:hypothetical protein
MVRVAWFIGSVKAMPDDLVDGGAHLEDVAGLFLVLEVVDAQQQAVVVDVQPLEDPHVVLDLLAQRFLDIRCEIDSNVFIKKIQVLQSNTRINVTLTRTSLGPSTLSRPLQVKSDINISSSFENISHDHEVDAYFAS